eukprot:10902636-Prorocentrum_lima.AAC.1
MRTWRQPSCHVINSRRVDLRAVSYRRRGVYRRIWLLDANVQPMVLMARLAFGGIALMVRFALIA